MNNVADRSKNLIPFVRQLPTDEVKYHRILNSTESVLMQSGLVVLEAGENVGSHNTGKHEELLIVLDGIGEVELKQPDRLRIQKNSVVYIPPDTQHNVFNIEKEPLRYLYIVSRVE